MAICHSTTITNASRCQFDARCATRSIGRLTLLHVMRAVRNDYNTSEEHETRRELVVWDRG